jgi:hypothetical protein
MSFMPAAVDIFRQTSDQPVQLGRELPERASERDEAHASGEREAIAKVRAHGIFRAGGVGRKHGRPREPPSPERRSDHFAAAGMPVARESEHLQRSLQMKGDQPGAEDRAAVPGSPRDTETPCTSARVSAIRWRVAILRRQGHRRSPVERRSRRRRTRTRAMPSRSISRRGIRGSERETRRGWRCA